MPASPKVSPRARPSAQQTQAAARNNARVALESAASRSPPVVANVIITLTPFILRLLDFIDAAGPYAIQAYASALRFWNFLQPYHPLELLPIVCGVCLCFFGGAFVTLIAAIEAFRLVGYQRLLQSLEVIYDSVTKALAASRKDDEVDDDNDGVADVLQISQQALVTRKISVVLKAIDPEKFAEATSAVWAGTLAIIATLRVTFAQAVTLGASLGSMIYTHAGPVGEPIVRNILPPEAQKWAPQLVTYVCQICGITIAWMVQRAISAFYSASRGGVMAATNLGLYLQKYQGIVIPPNVINGLGLLMAGVGFFWQLQNGFSVPFPLNLLLLPVTFVEYILMWTVGV